jgi:hypothetical protein
MLVRNVAIVADGLTSKDAAAVASEIAQLALAARTLALAAMWR